MTLSCFYALCIIFEWCLLGISDLRNAISVQKQLA